MAKLIRTLLLGLVLAAVVPAVQSVGEARTMMPGDSLSMGSCLLSDNGSYGLCAHNLFSSFYGLSWGGYVCNSGIHYFWDTSIDANCSSGYGTHTNQGSSAGSDGFAQMQSDGNFVLYTSGNSARWSTNTYGYGSGAFLNLQDDGNLVVYYNTNVPIWSIY